MDHDFDYKMHWKMILFQKTIEQWIYCENALDNDFYYENVLIHYKQFCLENVLEMVLRGKCSEWLLIFTMMCRVLTWIS